MEWERSLKLALGIMPPGFQRMETMRLTLVLVCYAKYLNFDKHFVCREWREIITITIMTSLCILYLYLYVWEWEELGRVGRLKERILNFKLQLLYLFSMQNYQKSLVLKGEKKTTLSLSTFDIIITGKVNFGERTIKSTLHTFLPLAPHSLLLFPIYICRMQPNLYSLWKVIKRFSRWGLFYFIHFCVRSNSSLFENSHSLVKPCLKTLLSFIFPENIFLRVLETTVLRKKESPSVPYKYTYTRIPTTKNINKSNLEAMHNHICVYPRHSIF